MENNNTGFRFAFMSRVFSFPIMCMFLLSVVIFAHCPGGIGIAETDIWWHLNDARVLLQHHSFSPIDIYSFSAAGTSWMDWEWLSEIPFFLAFNALGLQGLLLVNFAVVMLIYAGVYYRSCRAGADPKDAVLTTVAAVFLGGAMLAPRTSLFGWLCMTALLLIMDRFGRTGKGLWLLPPLFALWINLHGSWAFGMVVLAIIIASGLVQGKYGLVVATRWSTRDLKCLILVFFACSAAVFINPFGYKLVFYPLDFQFRQKPIVQNVSYWHSVDFSARSGHLGLVLIFGLLAIALFSSRPWKLKDVLLVAFALWAALSHVRFLDFAAIVITPVIAPHLKLFPPYDRKQDKPWLNLVIMVGAVLALVFLLPPEAKLQQKLESELPKAALGFMQQRQIQGNIFNCNEFGSYIEWTAPQFKTFIDGREDLFVYAGVFDDYLRSVAIQDPQKIFDKYHIGYALLQNDSSLGYFLAHSPQWRLLYSDQVAVLFERVPANDVAAESSAVDQGTKTLPRF